MFLWTHLLRENQLHNPLNQFYPHLCCAFINITLNLVQIHNVSDVCKCILYLMYANASCI